MEKGIYGRQESGGSGGKSVGSMQKRFLHSILFLSFALRLSTVISPASLVEKYSEEMATMRQRRFIRRRRKTLFHRQNVRGKKKKGKKKIERKGEETRKSVKRGRISHDDEEEDGRSSL
jgi:hypothetical protein